jgi:WD40 repeat protein
MRTINLSKKGTAVAYSSNGSVLAVGCFGISQLFDSATGEQLAELEADRGWVESVSFSCNDCTLATASGNSIHLWDVNTGSFITELQNHGDGKFISVAFHPYINHVLVAHNHCCIWAWDISNTPQSTSFEMKWRTSCLCWLQTSGLQQYVLVGCWKGHTEMWDVELSQRVKVFIPPLSEKPPRRVQAVASSHDGSLVASGSEDGRVIVYNTNLGHSVYYFQLNKTVSSVAFSPTEQILACGLGSNSVYIFYLDKDHVVSLDGHQDCIQSVVFSPDGQFLTSASDDKTLNIWETSAANSVAVNVHHLAKISSIQFSHNGSLLLTHSYDHTTKMWDTGTGTLYATGKEKLWNAVILSNGVHVVSLSSNKTLTLWDRQQEKPLCTNETLKKYDSVQIFPYSHHTDTLGFISIHHNNNEEVHKVCCWAIELMHIDRPQMVPVVCGIISLGSEFHITQITHKTSMEKEKLMLVIDLGLEEQKKFSVSWDKSTMSSEQLQELHFVEDSEQSPVEGVPASPAIKQIKAHTSTDGAWVLNENNKQVLWLPPGNRPSHHSFRFIRWYGQKLAVGGESGQVTLADFSNVDENND